MTSEAGRSRHRAAFQAERGLIDRARLPLDIAKAPLHGVGATPHHPNPTGGVRGASRSGRLRVRDHHSCSVSDGCRVQNGVGYAPEFRVASPLSDSMFRVLSVSRAHTAAREGSPPSEGRLPQAKLLRNSNQIARGRIRRFESDMPSQAVRSLGGMSGLEKCF
jgi:hypothetical protein